MTEINNFLAFIQSSYRPKSENIKSVENKYVKAGTMRFFVEK